MLREYHLTYARQHGNPEIINFMEIKLATFYFQNAFYDGNLERMKFWMLKLVNLEKYPIDKAVLQGNIAVIKSLIKEAVVGHLYLAILQERSDIVKILVEEGVKPNTNCLFFATIQGDLNMVEYLVEKGVNLDENLLNYARQYVSNQAINTYLEHAFARQNQRRVNL